MADIGYLLLNPKPISEPFIITADANPSVTLINHKITMVRNYTSGKDPNTVWFKFIVSRYYEKNQPVEHLPGRVCRTYIFLFCRRYLCYPLC